MSLEELKSKIRSANEEAWCKGNVDAFDEIYAIDCAWHSPPLPDVEGLEAGKERVVGIRQAYSDIQVTYEEWIAEEDTIVYRWTWQAKHTGQSPSLPIPPTGKEVIKKGCVVVHIADGKIVEELEYADYLGFLQQLGVVPPLG